MKQTTNKYEKALKQYGALAILMLLTELEKEEKYEHCQKLYDAVVDNFTDVQLDDILNNADARIALAREEAIRSLKIEPDTYIDNINEYMNDARTMITFGTHD
jgi:hypothetical protein